jgi:mRNA interferase MazF
MRDIHIAQLDKPRPVAVLTREPVRAAMDGSRDGGAVTTTAQGLSTGVPIGLASGLDQPRVVGCDSIITIDKGALGRHVGFLSSAGSTNSPQRSSAPWRCTPTNRSDPEAARRCSSRVARRPAGD